MKSKDRNVLDKVIFECVSAGMPELAADIQKARSVADILHGGTGGIDSRYYNTFSGFSFIYNAV